MAITPHQGSAAMMNEPVAPTSRRSLRRAAVSAAQSVTRRLLRWTSPSARSLGGVSLCETLEGRQLLSRAPLLPVTYEDVFSTPTDGSAPVVVGKNLVVNGTKKSDTIILKRDAAGLNVTVNGVLTTVTDSVLGIKVFGGSKNDIIRVDDSRDYKVGDVFVDGGSGNDQITTGDGNDTIYGGSGNDLLNGGNGNDTIYGGKGNDRVIGGNGDDKLYGESGRNTFGPGTGNNETDAAISRRNILAPVASAPASRSQANPLAVFGTATGLTPTQIRNQYGFGNLSDSTFTNRGAGQAVAVVIPYDVKQLFPSVNTFSTQFGLPQMDTNNLVILNANGTTPPDDPDPNNGWETEAVLSTSWIHAIAPQATIYVVLTPSDLFTDLFTGVDEAVNTLVQRHGGGTVLMTFGSQNGELSSGLQAYLDQSFTRKAARSVTFVTGSGDVPGTVSYPATSPYVVSVGGTSLERDTLGNLTGNESGWQNSGGGLSSVYTTAPGFQTGTTVGGTQVARRATPDLAMNADPASGYALYVAEGFGDVDGDNIADSGWLPGGAGGTSASAPIVAGIVALSNELRLASGRTHLGINFNDAIYDLNRVYPGFYFNDITTGTSGANTAAAGYDLVTGNGSPRAGLLIDRLASAATSSLSFNNVDWYGEFREAINKVGIISTPGAGFINGRGSISGNNSLSMTLTPRYDLTPAAPQFPSSASGGGASGTGTTTSNNLTPTQIVVDQFTPVTMLRLDNNMVTGTARVNVTILLAPLALPSPSTPDDNAGNGGTTPTTPTTPTPQPVPGFFVAGLDDSVPPNANGEIRTWQIDLNFSGKIYRDKKGRERIQGDFINRFSLYNPGGEPVEGLEPIFRGKFSA